MFRKMRNISDAKTFALAAALLAHPCGMVAQHGGGGGGHVGGGAAGGGGLSGGGRATGLDTKDDLKDFHEALAVQANSQQINEFNLMVKSTEDASAELLTFLEHVAKDKTASELAARGKTLEQAIEKARSDNTKFLERLSDRQKSGLKETIKKLTKADSELAQQAKTLDLEVEDTKGVGPRIAGLAQSLDRALTSFHTQQISLGEEMSVAAHHSSQDFSLNIPPAKSSVTFKNQIVAITTAGMISKSALHLSGNTFRLDLTADMSDLQQNITEVLRAQLDKDDPCGEQIAIRSATLTPSTPASLVLAQVHYERWRCFGRGTPNEMAEGNGTIEVKLTAAVGEDGTLRLVPEIARIDAQGLIGELLRSGSLGEVVRDKIAETLLSILRHGSDYKTVLPPAAQGNVTLHRAQFQGTGSGKLSVVLQGDLQVSSDKVTSLTSDLKPNEAKGQPASPETTPR
jgi:hypothetical protein